MATQEQKQLVAGDLRRVALDSLDERVTLRKAYAAVADLLDPPAPRTVTIAGVKFQHKPELPYPWRVWDGRGNELAGATPCEAFTTMSIDPTPEEYARLYALQTEAR